MTPSPGLLSGCCTQRVDLFVFAGINNVKFRKPVVPGDQLFLHSTIKRRMRNMVQYVCEAKVEGKVVAKAELLCASASK